jgi:hypothetical protein
MSNRLPNRDAQRFSPPKIPMFPGDHNRQNRRKRYEIVARHRQTGKAARQIHTRLPAEVGTANATPRTPCPLEAASARRRIDSHFAKKYVYETTR